MRTQLWMARVALTITSLWLALLVVGIAVTCPGFRPERLAVMGARRLGTLAQRELSKTGATFRVERWFEGLSQGRRRSLAIDPWGRSYQPATAGKDPSFISLGADGLKGTCDDISDSGLGQACYPDPVMQRRLYFWGSVAASPLRAHGSPGSRTTTSGSTTSP